LPSVKVYNAIFCAVIEVTRKPSMQALDLRFRLFLGLERFWI